MSRIYNDIGLAVPSVLLPKAGSDFSRWAVVACDQYTSQPEYWEAVTDFVGTAPSTNNLILPEVWLEKPGVADRIASVNKTMRSYLDTGVFAPARDAFVLVDRKTAHAPSRKGLVVSMDLETYEYTKGTQALCRATEGTVIERLPPRIRIRENASLELPHIMVLIDDPDHTVIAPLFKEKLDVAYDFELMQKSGHIKGWYVDRDEQLSQVTDALRALASRSSYEERYGVSGGGVLLYAVGDGNHSLASAKAHWENVKKASAGAKDLDSHPARWALVELVNVHDEGLVFEPIHRVLFDVNTTLIQSALKAWFENEGSSVEIEKLSSVEHVATEVRSRQSRHAHVFAFVDTTGGYVVTVDKPVRTLEAATLQAFLDSFMSGKAPHQIDYIHGDDVVLDLGTRVGNAGFLLPAMSKHDLFLTVIKDGALPRKTFSMGEADEKRFYLEARKIVK